MANKPGVPATMLGKVMELTIKDRLIIIQLLPPRASMAGQIMAKHVMKKVQITDKEKEGLEWKEDGGRAFWKDEVAPKIKVKFTLDEIDFLRAQVKEFDEKKMIPMDFIDTLLRIQGVSDIEEEGESEQGPDVDQEEAKEIPPESPGEPGDARS